MPKKCKICRGGGYLSTLYSEKAFAELEAKRVALPEGETLGAKDAKKLAKLVEGKKLYDQIIECLNAQVESANEAFSLDVFLYLLEETFKSWDIEINRNTLLKIAKGLSTPDPKADIERDKDGEIVYDEELKDVEIVPFKENIDDYMAREVLPHLPGAKAFFLEDLSAKKPVIKTGAEFPFTRYFYKYLEPEKSEEILKEIVALDEEIAADLAAIKGNEGEGER